MTSRHPWNGLSRHVLKFANFRRLSARKDRNEAASAGDRAAIARSIRSTSGVARSSPPLPKISRYCGSSRTSSTSSRKSRPTA